MSFTIAIGTSGAGLHLSYDSGKSFQHLFDPMNVGGNVIGPSESLFALAVFPDEPHHLLAGSTGNGLYESHDNGHTWAPLPSPIAGTVIWSIAIDPTDGDRIYVGAQPTAFRSIDRGASWEEMPVGVAPRCAIGVPHVTAMVVDPANPARVWAGVEVDGIFRSDDHGTTWQHLDSPGPTLFHGDIHTMAVRGGDVIATTPFGVATSSDDGKTWSWHAMPEFVTAPSPLGAAYCRALEVPAGAMDTVLVGCGDTTPGQIGTLQVSRDGGSSFSPATFDTTPNSVVYALSTHLDLPDVIAAITLFGQVFLSEDGGNTFAKTAREFGEIRTVAISPN